MIRTIRLSAACLLACHMAATAQIHTPKKVMDDFMDLRFGMFIHWGPVTLKGTEIGWSRGKEVPVKVYDNLYRRFDPVSFNADAWVKTAKDAGMKYLVITAKHHDGFCLWPSAYTDYDIAHTPFKKDVVGALAKACKKQGIKFCIYYSVLDWHHPDYPFHDPSDSVRDPNADMSRYISYMKNQLKELITRYHPFMLWFDGNWESAWTGDEAKDMYQYIKRLDPDVIVNNRLGADNRHAGLDERSVGDFATPEQQIGAMDMAHPWESCITICTQWAWKPGDPMKSLAECLRILAGTAGGNGNLLLNVSPRSDGLMEPRQVARLKEIGDWMKKNGAAIYGTHGGPYRPNKNYTATRKGNRINILLLKPVTGVFTLPPVAGFRVVKAGWLGGGHIPFTQDNRGIRLTLAGTLSGPPVPVIVLEMNKNTAQIPLIP